MHAHAPCSNGYMQVQVNPATGMIVSMIGDFTGGGSFPASANALTAPWGLETVGADGTVSSGSAPARLDILANTSDLVSIRLSGVTDAVVSRRFPNLLTRTSASVGSHPFDALAFFSLVQTSSSARDGRIS